VSEFMILDEAVVPATLTIDTSEEATATPNAAIPLTRWLDLHAAGDDLSTTGVILLGDSDLDALQPHLDLVAFVAVHFPKFADGRGYSHAARLRKLWGYDGTLLAFGDVLRDQLFYMSRCGFNAFRLRADQDPHACIAAFSLYTRPYQYD
jgi:uncharacterized protein (DUF934 family)